MYNGMNRHNSVLNNLDFPGINRLANAHLGIAAWILFGVTAAFVVLNMATPTLLNSITFNRWQEMAAGFIALAVVFIALDHKGFTSAVKVG